MNTWQSVEISSVWRPLSRREHLWKAYFVPLPAWEPEPGQPAEPMHIDTLPNGLGEPDVLEAYSSLLIKKLVIVLRRAHCTMQWSQRVSMDQPHMLIPVSARLRRPTTHYGDPVEIPETIPDEDLFRWQCPRRGSIEMNLMQLLTSQWAWSSIFNLMHTAVWRHSCCAIHSVMVSM